MLETDNVLLLHEIELKLADIKRVLRFAAKNSQPPAEKWRGVASVAWEERLYADLCLKNRQFVEQWQQVYGPDLERLIWLLDREHGELARKSVHNRTFLNVVDSKAVSQDPALATAINELIELPASNDPSAILEAYKVQMKEEITLFRHFVSPILNPALYTEEGEAAQIATQLDCFNDLRVIQGLRNKIEYCRRALGQDPTKPDAVTQLLVKDALGDKDFKAEFDATMPDTHGFTRGLLELYLGYLQRGLVDCINAKKSSYAAQDPEFGHAIATYNVHEWYRCLAENRGKPRSNTFDGETSGFARVGPKSRVASDQGAPENGGAWWHFAANALSAAFGYSVATDNKVEVAASRSESLARSTPGPRPVNATGVVISEQQRLQLGGAGMSA